MPVGTTNPVPLQYAPASHGVHCPALYNPDADEYVPGGQTNCPLNVVLAGQIAPGPHSAGVTLPNAHANDGGHALQLDSPSSSA